MVIFTVYMIVSKMPCFHIPCIQTAEVENGRVTMYIIQHSLYSHREPGTGLLRKQSPKSQIFLGFTKDFLAASKSDQSHRQLRRVCLFWMVHICHWICHLTLQWYCVQVPTARGRYYYSTEQCTNLASEANTGVGNW